MTHQEKALLAHAQWQGKIEVVSRVPVNSAQDLALAYTPGVAEPCKEIAKSPEAAYQYTRKGNMVAVVTDGSAVLGLGNIGALAGLPVMEGKCVLFKQFAGVDAFPILVNTQDTDEIVRTVLAIAPGFGGINLEDIAAPRCFEVERRLAGQLDIPVFHDDQHGTAIVAGAALLGALAVVGKSIDKIRMVINGAGAAGTACAQLAMALGVLDIVLCDKEGVLDPATQSLDDARKALAQSTNPRGVRGTLADAVSGADVFLGVSAPNVLTPEMVKSMNRDAIVFAMANPVPEIMPDLAKAAGARVVGTGRSDFANQINNVLAFPGLFRGALDVRAKCINLEMKLAATRALAELAQSGLSEEAILPKAFDPAVGPAVAKAVMQAALETGAAT